MERFKNFVLATSLLAGVIIGAGIFVLPFVFAKVGFITGLIYLAIFTFVFITIHLMYAQIILKTPGREHRFAGYAKIYFGKWGYYFATFMTIIGMFFILAVYLVLAISFFGPLGLPVGLLGLLIFWVVSSWPIFLNIDKLADLEFISNVAIFAIIFVLFFVAWPHSFEAPLFESLNIDSFFLPFGLIFFSLAGRTAIPQVIKYFRESETFSINQAIIWGTVTPALIYVVFIYAVLSVNGTVSEDAISGLTNLPSALLFSLAILALINLWNSYIIIGVDVKESLSLDFDFPEWQSGLIVVAAPLVIYLLGFQKFLPLIGFTGGVFLGLEGIFIVLMWRKLVNKPSWEWLTILLVSIFLLAIGYQFFNVL